MLDPSASPPQLQHPIPQRTVQSFRGGGLEYGYGGYEGRRDLGQGHQDPAAASFARQQQQAGGYGQGGPMYGAQPAAAGPFGQALWPDDATAAMGMHFGRTAVMAGQEYVQQNLSKVVPSAALKPYFNVTNLYVLSKLRLVLFPWRHKPWSRSPLRGDDGVGPNVGPSGRKDGYRPPREDINSPDLYIPVMALVTYILLTTFYAGLSSRFHPQLLGQAASKSLGILFFEFVAIKLGCYLLNISGQSTVVELVGYSGYKFVGIIVVTLARLLGLQGLWVWTIFFYVCISMGFFLLRSLRYVVLPESASSATATSATVSPMARNRRIQFLFSIAAFQIVSMWILTPGGPSAAVVKSGGGRGLGGRY